MKAKLLALLVVAVAGTVLGMGSGRAQVDLAKSLVGKWQGEVQLASGVSGDPNRTLIIESVTQKDGSSVAAGRFGITGQGLGKVEIEVSESSGRPFIRFVTAAATTIRLTLTGPRDLTGTTTLPGTSNSGRGNDLALTLQKKD